MTNIEKKTNNWNLIMNHDLSQKPETNIEIWMWIEGYEGHYQVSSKGRIKAAAREAVVKTKFGEHTRKYSDKIMKQRFDRDGYRMVTLTVDGEQRTFQSHRLVAEAFIPNPQRKLEVNHKDMDKANNDISNLEWVTRQENATHYEESTKDRKLDLMRAVWDNPNIHYKELMDRFGFSQTLTYKIRNIALELMEVE